MTDNQDPLINRYEAERNKEKSSQSNNRHWLTQASSHPMLMIGNDGCCT